MGEFARGIHIYKERKEQILQAIPAMLQDGSFVSCESDDFDRAVAVIESGDWVSVFDSDMYDDSFNKALSLQTAASCVAIELYDGDCLQAVIWKNGRRVNTYVSHPEYVDLRRTPSNGGNAQKWNAVTKDTGAVQAVFESSDDATSKLFELSNALAIPGQLTQMQYSYLEEMDGMDITYLYFRDTRKPPVPETPVFEWCGGLFPAPLNREASAETQSGGIPRSILQIGEMFTVTCHFINTGKAGKGITMCFVGESLESESVVFEQVQLLDGISFEGSALLAEAHFEKVNFQDGRKGYYAKFEEPEICRSISLYDHTFKTWKAAEYRPYSIKIWGKVVAAETEYEAFLVVHPNDMYDKGSFGREMLGDVIFR